MRGLARIRSLWKWMSSLHKVDRIATYLACWSNTRLHALSTSQFQESLLFLFSSTSDQLESILFFFPLLSNYLGLLPKYHLSFSL